MEKTSMTNAQVNAVLWANGLNLSKNRKANRKVANLLINIVNAEIGMDWQDALASGKAWVAENATGRRASKSGNECADCLMPNGKMQSDTITALEKNAARMIQMTA